MNTYGRFPVSFPKGEGVYLYNEKGEKFLDLMSGIGVNALGYNHPKIKKALQEAIQKPLHLSNLYEIPEQEKLAKKLCEDSPFDEAFFCNSGTEANEGAIKLVRKFWSLSGVEGTSQKKNIKNEKNIIISFSSSFHGRTMGSLALTGKDSIKTGFTPLIGNTQILEWNNLEDLENYFSGNNRDNVAAIFLEPIQGEGGINIPDNKFLKKISEICKKYNVLLVVDEVQTGIGRTGKKFAFEYFDIQPDVICLAKGLGGGVPIGAILATKKISSAFTPSTHGSTFGGNPFVCTVATAVCDEVLEENFLNSIVKTGINVCDEIQILMNKYPEILLDKRGKGLMIGIEINSVENRNFLLTKFLEKNILVLPSGDKTLRLLPPLIITKEEMKVFWKVFDDILQKM